MAETIRFLHIIRIEASTGALKVYCPYSSQFVDFARMRNGKWSDGAKCWVFDPRDEFAVRSTLVDIYGTDDYAACSKVDMRISLDPYSTDMQRIFLVGREIAHRRFWDRSVTLGPGVAVITGGFRAKPTSRKNITCEALDGTILEVRDVPRAIAERAYIKHPNSVEILGGIDRLVLQTERERLLERLSEIDELLSRVGEPKEDNDDIPSDLRDDSDEPPEAGC